MQSKKVQHLTTRAQPMRMMVHRRSLAHWTLALLLKKVHLHNLVLMVPVLVPSMLAQLVAGYRRRSSVGSKEQHLRCSTEVQLQRKLQEQKRE